MSRYRIGIAGYGNMGAAIVRGLVSAGVFAADEMAVYDPSSAACDSARTDGLAVLGTPGEIGDSCDIGIVAVKPKMVADVVAQIAASTGRILIVSIAAGVTISALEKNASGHPVIRVMPNTPCQTGAGASAVSRGTNAADSDVDSALKIMGALGLAVEVPEELMDAVTGLSGSGPAYVALVIDALADGGVKAGLPRATALALAAQTVFGAAKMIRDESLTPSALRDMVASPGGTTIAGVAALESWGVRAAFIDAVEAATERSRELGS